MLENNFKKFFSDTKAKLGTSIAVALVAVLMGLRGQAQAQTGEVCLDLDDWDTLDRALGGREQVIFVPDLGVLLVSSQPGQTGEVRVHWMGNDEYCASLEDFQAYVAGVNNGSVQPTETPPSTTILPAALNEQGEPTWILRDGSQLGYSWNASVISVYTLLSGEWVNTANYPIGEGVHADFNFTGCISLSLETVDDQERVAYVSFGDRCGVEN
jgi:hypothetical protein